MSRNTLREYRSRHRQSYTAPRRRFVPATGRKPRVFDIPMVDGTFAKVEAMTRSEARAITKRTHPFRLLTAA